MENNTVEFLLSKIDDELIKLHDAPNLGTYKVFDFKTALNKLGSELKRNEYSDYHKEKISHLVAVFNDLCNDIIETFYYRDIAYDKITHIAKTEETSYNKTTGEYTENIREREVMEELREYLSTKDLPEKYSEKLTETCKVDYWLKNCTIDYSFFYPAIKNDFNGTLEDEKDLANYLYIIDELLRKGDSFDSYFDIDINYLWKHRINFEQYVFRLKKERDIMNDRTEMEHKPSTIYLSKEKSKKIDYIRVINCLFELGFFQDESGNKILKKTVMELFGTLVNIDLANYDKDLSATKSSAKADGTSLLRIFNQMIDKQKSINNIN